MKEFNKEEIEVILTKPYLSVDDISVLVGCSQSKAYRIFGEIKQDVINAKKKTVIKGRLSTWDVLSRLDNDYYYRIYKQIVGD